MFDMCLFIYHFYIYKKHVSLYLYFAPENFSQQFGKRFFRNVLETFKMSSWLGLVYLFGLVLFCCCCCCCIAFWKLKQWHYDLFTVQREDPVLGTGGEKME